MGKVILVTGASRGIGKDIAIQLAKQGHKVIVNYNKSKEKAEQIKNDLQQQGYTVQIYQADVSKQEQVNAMIDFCIQTFGTLDVLINNAGISQIKLFTDVTKQDWDTMINVNLNSIFYACQKAVPIMIHQKEGLIINISSIWGETGASCEVPYSTTKAAIHGFSKALAKELAPSGIRVNVIAPGCIKTDMNKELDEETIQELKTEIPLGRMGNPSDITKCVEWLIQDEYTTGQIVSINGGWNM